MLVLSRKTEESIVVGGAAGFESLLKVTVLEIGGDRVRLGFDVDKKVPVHRWEVWERINARGPPDDPLIVSSALVACNESLPRPKKNRRS